MKLAPFKADLHVHTCLSPCGEFEMSPMKVVAEARSRGLDLIAVCDHNSAANVAGVRQAAEGSGLAVLAGMEVATAEEVHLLALFDEIDSALSLQSLVYARLLPGENDEDLFGMQVVANGLDEVEKIEHRLLISATQLDIDTVVAEIHRLGGLVVASHIDRESNSLIGQLGMVPPDLPLDAVEVSPRGDVEAMRAFPGVAGFPVIRSSDAHRLEDLGRMATTFLLADPTAREIGLALRGEDGRAVQGWGAAP